LTAWVTNLLFVLGWKDMKNAIIWGIIILVLVIIGSFFLWGSNGNDEPAPTITDQEPLVKEVVPAVDKTKTVLGVSAQGRDLVAYHYGDGAKEVIFIGGIHGGYSWNTVLVAYELMDYLAAGTSTVPAGVKVTVIPALNPDGLFATVGTTSRFAAAQVPASEDLRVAGRFNGNTVDLNRNFDCDWQANAKWQNKDVSGGTTVFSEPETLAVKNYIEQVKPAAVVVWYSAAGGVFASNCHDGVLPETAELTKLFARASGYRAYDNFNFYEITGDMVNWLAKEKIPAISVLLTDHKSTEWSKNLAGIKALLNYYAE